MVPAAPSMAVGGITKWASGKIGPWAWVALASLLIAGGLIYYRQPDERREKIRAGAVEVGTFVLDRIMEATTEVEAARAQLRARIVAGPATRSPGSAILRELALSDQSLSAQQLADRLEDSVLCLCPDFVTTSMPTTMHWFTRCGVGVSCSARSTSSKFRLRLRSGGLVLARNSLNRGTATSRTLINAQSCRRSGSLPVAIRSGDPWYLLVGCQRSRGSVHAIAELSPQGLVLFCRVERGWCAGRSAAAGLVQGGGSSAGPLPQSGWTFSCQLMCRTWLHSMTR
jgi:hypothetical protein